LHFIERSRGRPAAEHDVRGHVELNAALSLYGAIAALGCVATLIALGFTKKRRLVMPGAALVATICVLVWARLEAGYWDKLVGVAFVVCFVFAFVVSAATIFVGRSLGIRYFKGTHAP
jgi:small basic protein